MVLIVAMMLVNVFGIGSIFYGHTYGTFTYYTVHYQYYYSFYQYTTGTR